MVIRPGRAAELPQLRAIAIESKAYWPYGPDFIDRFAAVMLRREDYFQTHEVWVADDQRAAVGIYSLIHGDQLSLLDDLWLRPAHIGRGFGRRLFEHARRQAGLAGSSRMEWEAEPHARSFYARMGVRLCGRSSPSWAACSPS